MKIETTQKLDITMTRGDTLAFNIRLKGLEDNLDSAYFTVTQPEQYEFTQIFQKSLNNGITNLGDGVYSVRVAPEDTAQMFPKAYRYDIEIGINDDIFTPFAGDLILERGSTQHEQSV